jgi:hypothetical protein
LCQKQGRDGIIERRYGIIERRYKSTEEESRVDR